MATRKSSVIMPTDTDDERIKELNAEMREALSSLRDQDKQSRLLDRTYTRDRKNLDKLLAATQKHVDKLNTSILKLKG
jgi:tripartite-type tricarboxylate transporter receptor subunit TctC